MTTWFTSDLHLGHARIIELCNRPYADVREMNEEIIRRWNAVVSSGDQVYVLGDVALGKIDESLPLVARLAGTKLLVPGNHDRCWSGNKKIRPIDRSRYEAVFDQILPEQHTYTDWLLCHFPTAGDSHTEDRYPEHRPTLPDRQWLIHGHVHQMWKINGRQINVGVDRWNFTPVCEEELRAIVHPVG
jgi:calcineurin-like phosphoesterase family protein